MSLVAELKRRNVFKVGAAYLVIAWLVVQAASIGFPAFDAPPWVLRVFILVVALGFPVALVLAWVFDVTPEGVKVEPASVGNKRMFTVAAVLAALAVGWFMRGGIPGAPHDAVIFEAPLGAQSTAVLPFVNMSSDKENEYFSDGLTETLLHKLAQVPQLKVAARTSAFAFKGKQEDIRAIGRELGVATVMEGSVQRAGDTLRITAQLVRTSDGSHIWSRAYDRKLADLFAIQDEIAGAVTEALVGALVPEAKAAIAKGGTQDVAAYDLYTKGLAEQNIASFDSLKAAEALFKQALEKDPKYVDAMLGLVYTWDALQITGSISRDAATDRIEPMLDKVEALDPGNALLLGARAELAYARNQPEAGAALFERALAAAPQDATLLYIYAASLDANKPEELAKALGLIERAVKVDPLNARVEYNHAALLGVAKRLDEAVAAAERVIAIDPKSPVGYQVLGSINLQQDRLAEQFLNWRRSQVYDPTDHELASELAFQLDILGDRAGADAWLAKSFAIAPDNLYPFSMQVDFAFRRGDMPAAYAGALPLMPRHSEDRRANWGRALVQGCFAAIQLGKVAEYRKALVASRFFPDGLTPAAINAIATERMDARHVIGHIGLLSPCLMEPGAAGAAQRAELVATATALLGADWARKLGADAPMTPFLTGDRAGLVKAFLKSTEGGYDLARSEAWTRWFGIADDPQIVKDLAAKRAVIQAEAARLGKVLADAGVERMPPAKAN